MPEIKNEAKSPIVEATARLEAVAKVLSFRGGFIQIVITRIRRNKMTNNSSAIGNGAMETRFKTLLRQAFEAYWEKRSKVPYDGRPKQAERLFQGLVGSSRTAVEGK